MDMEKKGLVEAALFMSPEPLGIDKISKIAGVQISEALKIVQELIDDYRSRPGLEITRIEGGKYRMQVRDEYLPYVKDFATALDMTKAVLRTLALIAFNQPIKQSEVVKVRGNKAYDHIKELKDKGFIKSRKFRNTLVLETTRKFDEYFGPIERKRELSNQKRLMDYENNRSVKPDNLGH